MKALELAGALVGHLPKYKTPSKERGLINGAIEELRRLAAVEAELERIKALEPVMVYHGACTIDCGEHGHHHTEMLKMIPAGTKLYALGSKTA